MPIPRHPPPAFGVSIWDIARYPSALPDANRSAAPAPAADASGEASHNWAGGYVRTQGNERLASVRGGWTVPGVCSSPRGHNPVHMQVVSIWIGLDGHGPASRAMPQIGTFQSLPYAGQHGPECYVWWWWWVRDAGLAEPKRIDIAVRPGDRIVAEITVLTPRQVRLMFQNLTTGKTATADVSAPWVTSPDGAREQPEIEAHTAEWIVERPTEPARDQRHTLPDFGRVQFSDCAVTLSSGPADAILRERAYIRMRDWEDTETPGITVAAAAPGQDGCIQIDYTGPK